MFAKAVFLTQKIHRLHRTLRGQVRSYKAPRTPVGANLFAKAVFLTQKIHRLNRTLRGQVRSYKAPRTHTGVCTPTEGAAVRLVREGASCAFYIREGISDQYDLILALALGLIHRGVGAAVEGFEAWVVSAQVGQALAGSDAEGGAA